MILKVLDTNLFVPHKFNRTDSLYYFLSKKVKGMFTLFCQDNSE